MNHSPLRNRYHSSQLLVFSFLSLFYMNISRWDGKLNLRQCYTMVLSSCRNSGKSYLVKDLFKKNRMNAYYDVIVIFSKTLLTGFYDFVETKFKYENFQDSVLENLMELQRERKNQGKPLLKALVLIDDYLDSKMGYKQTIIDIFSLGRHMNISLIQLVQNLNFLTGVMKQNTTIAITLKLKGRGKINFINHYMMDLFDDVTEEREILRISSRILTRVFEEQYRALVLLFEDENPMKFYKAG